MTPDKRVEENPEKEYLDRNMNQMLENLEKTAKVPFIATENKIREIVKIECEKMYPEFLQRDCNDLLVILTGRLQITLTQYHQDLMSEVVERVTKAILSARPLNPQDPIDTRMAIENEVQKVFIKSLSE